MRRLLAPLLAALLLVTPVAAQETNDVDVGAGDDVNVAVEPGLGPATPVEGEIAPEDVPLFVPAEDQIRGRVTIPDDKLGTLVQPEGRQWRAFRIQGVFWAMTAAILVTVAALAGFYLWKGTIPIEAGRSGRWIRRFGGLDRFAHWLTALSFLTLAITGLILIFGRTLLIPVIGHWAYTPVANVSKYLHNWSGAPFVLGLILIFGRTLLIPVIGHWAYTPVANVSKYLHNWSGVPFVLGLVLMLVLWVRDNLPRRSDITWFRQAGGIFNAPGSPHLETGRFNAGQKIIFWSVILGGGALAVTGYLLMMPFFFTGVTGMQIFHVIHALLAVVMVSIIIVHIYIGTLGMEGAFDAMGHGDVDVNWAREHHSGWYEAETSGRTEAEGRGVPAE